MLIVPDKPLQKQELCALIPHSGNMCLLEQVFAWDEIHIHCLATSHRDPDNPLRRNGSLNSISGVEYAAQAMAIHGSLSTLVSRFKPQPGFIASVRDVAFFIDRLDLIQEKLHIKASRLSGSEGGFVYEFQVTADTQGLMSGRIAVILNAGK